MMKNGDRLSEHVKITEIDCDQSYIKGTASLTI